MNTWIGTSNQTAHGSLVQKHPLLAFFVLAIGLSWIFMIADALGSHGIVPFRLSILLMIVMGYMPTLAAVIVTWVTKGREGIWALLRKLLIARVGLKWYLAAIFGFGLLCVFAIALYNLFGGRPPLPILSGNAPPISKPFELILGTVFIFVVRGAVNGEELAWRGFALPRLQSKWNALTSSLILGMLWTLFHLPLFFTLTGSSQAGTSFVNFMIGTVSLTVLFTWIYNHTRGSVLLAYLLHAAANTWTQVFSIDHGNATVGWILTGLIALAAVVVVLATGPENLSREGTRVQETDGIRENTLVDPVLIKGLDL